MPSGIMQKYPRRAQDDTALIETMETLLEHFDRIAAMAVGSLPMLPHVEPVPSDIERARELVKKAAQSGGGADVSPECIETVAVALASDLRALADRKRADT